MHLSQSQMRRRLSFDILQFIFLVLEIALVSAIFGCGLLASALWRVGLGPVGRSLRGGEHASRNVEQAMMN
jgi:hypothetical protein